MREFKVNDYLTLKFEYGRTNIYVKGESFKQCKSLHINIPLKDIEFYDEIESIDEATDILNVLERVVPRE